MDAKSLNQTDLTIPRAIGSRTRPVAFPLGLMLAMIWCTLGCTTFSSISESLFLISPEKEIELGRKLIPELEKDITYLRDPQVVDYIQSLGREVWRFSDKGPIAPHFFVIKNKEINAFAIPGGNIYVHTGLIEAADDEAELVGVIAHEVGHVVRRHSARHLSHTTGMNVLSQVALGEDSGEATKMLTGLAGQMVNLRYSRQDESESDRIAVKTLHRSGYDPLALRTFFVKLKNKYGDKGGGAIGSLFASHPPTRDRMDRVQEWVKTLPPKTYRRPVTDLRRAQGRLLGQSSP
jgi:predicted Zn-dependent protease